MTDKEQKRVEDIISSHMTRMVNMLNKVNKDFEFEGLGEMGKHMLTKVAIAVEGRLNVDIILNILDIDDPDKDDDNEGLSQGGLGVINLN